jgi:hypothetical protein
MLKLDKWSVVKAKGTLRYVLRRGKSVETHLVTVRDLHADSVLLTN